MEQQPYGQLRFELAFLIEVEHAGSEKALSVNRPFSNEGRVCVLERKRE